MNSLDKKLDEVLKFWFEELEPKDWWKKSDDLDSEIQKRFSEIHKLASEGKLEGFRTSPQRRLAEIIVLDQFSRNMYRGTPASFAFDDMALRLAENMVADGEDLKLEKQERQFAYLPYMHSESLEVHDRAVELFAKSGLENNLKFEHAHRDIIVRFGRYPHRNKILGRQSSQEELEFLTQPGSSF